MQHAVQAREGFASGEGLSGGAGYYYNKHGEVEARNVQSRLEMQGKLAHPHKTQDTPIDETILQDYTPPSKMDYDLSKLSDEGLTELYEEWVMLSSAERGKYSRDYDGMLAAVKDNAEIFSEDFQLLDIIDRDLRGLGFNYSLKNNENSQKPAVKMNSKTRSYFDKLSLSSEKEFSDYVDKIVGKDYAKAENIKYIANINADLIKALNLKGGGKVFTLKKKLSHAHPERKGEYNQDLRIDEMKKIPSVINSAKTAYMDNKNGFFIVFDDKLNADKLNFIHFRGDSSGNFIITLKKASVKVLKSYKKVSAGGS